MTTELTKAADLQPGDIFAAGDGRTETVTHVEELGPHAVVVHTENGEYGTFANGAVFEMATETRPAVDRSHALHARPQAGAPAANQYGVFQVSYATEKQTAFIRSLMDRKDLSEVDPAKVDVEKLREQVANVQVNKKAASDIIDTLLALPNKAPDETLRRRPNTPATGPQKEFVRALLAEREGHEEAEAIRDQLNEARVSGNLTAAVVSAAINDLLEIPKAAAQIEAPAGRYALPAADGHFVFYKVDRPTEGKWAGYVFVKQLVGSVGSWDEQRLSRQAADNILANIAADPQEAARMFGIKAKACGMCASPLSNTRSRAAGYGETCAAKHGFFYPSEEQAREILAEREES